MHQSFFSPAEPGHRLGHGSISLVVALLFLSVTSIATAADYTRNDLDALAAAGEWNELLEHAKDIAPSERDAGFQSLVSKASVAALQQRATSDPMGAYELIVWLDREHKGLAQSSAWLVQRAESGLAAVQACLNESYNSSGCLNALDSLVAGDSENAELAFDAAALTRRHSNATRALPLLAAAFDHASDVQQAEYCAHQDTELIVLRGLENSVATAAAQAADLTFVDCQDTLVPTAFKAFLKGNRQLAINTCAAWRKRDQLSDFQEAHCTDMEAAR